VENVWAGFSVLSPDVTGQFRGIGLRSRQGEVHTVFDHSIDFFLDRSQFIALDQPSAAEVTFQRFKRITLGPELFLLLRTQLVGVSKGVAAESVGEALSQRRP
jgi:hypothetical protein